MKHRFLRNFKMTTCFCLNRLYMLMIGLLFMLGSVIEANAQNQVSGQVSDDEGNSLPGVNVLVKGTSQGTVTDVDGRYTLPVPGSESVLQFSFIGYVTEEVEVGTRSTINISLSPDIKTLSEIVVVGYGTQRREAVTGSVASISGDVMRDVPASNISQALQGRLPGVEMSQTNTKPGSAMQIRIRGSRSLTASNDPLVVLDGIPFPGSISEINPNDIKSIDILKDASATAIYGSRGANGVILVTTDRGSVGQKPRVNYNGYHGFKDVFSKFPMMNGPEYWEFRQQGQYNTTTLDESEDANTDWQDLLYRDARVMKHDIGISGGTQNGNYSVGMEYYKDEAVIPTQHYDRYSLRGTVDQEIGKRFRFGLSTNNNYNISEGNQVGLYGILSLSPILEPYNADGTWKRTARMPADDVWLYSKDVVEELQDRWLSETKGFGSYNSIYGEVKIPGVEGLKYRTNVGLSYRTSTGGSYTGQGVNSINPATESSASINNSLTTYWAIENMLTYDRTFNQKHMVNAVALYSAEETRFNRSQLDVRDIPADAFQYYNLGRAEGELTVNPDFQNYWASGLMSWMGRVMYSYDDRYMFTATLRSDGSSRLAPGNKWHTYPALSVGWNMKSESFMQNIAIIDMLKLRAGYGQTSNQSVDPYKTFGLLSTRPYNFGDEDFAVGYYTSELPNPFLGWEYSVTWNYGIDFSILNNRLSGTVEYYKTHTKDLLLRVGLPATAGVGSYMANVGETQNNGIEIALNGTILDNANGWTLEAGFNLYANRNKLVKLSSGVERDEGNWWFVGHPIDVIFDYKKIGIWQEEDPYLNILEGSGGQPGMIKVLYTGDYNSDGSPTRAIGADDRQIMSVEPNFMGGFNTRLAYKGFDLSAIGAFKNGGILISSLYSSAGYLNMMSGRRNNVKVDYWTPENTSAKYPKPGGPTSGDNPKYGSTLGYFNASYLKVRTLSLGYNFNESNWVNNLGIDNLRLYFMVQNPFVLFSPYHKESGMDPETNSYGNENAAVAYSQNLRRLLTIGTNTPSTRNYLIGINLSF